MLWDDTRTSVLAFRTAGQTYFIRWSASGASCRGRAYGCNADRIVSAIVDNIDVHGPVFPNTSTANERERGSASV